MSICKEESPGIKITDRGNNFNKFQKTSGLIYFNRNDFVSDTEGDLKGTVYYVQNCITPSHNYIPDDVYQRVISNRQMMILFRPHENYLNEIYLNIKDRENRMVLTRTMVSDDTKIPLALQERVIFSIPSRFDIVIDKNNELRKISSDIKAFEEIILKNNTINVITSNFNFAEAFELNTNIQFSGKKIFFVCNSDYSFKVLRQGMNEIKLSKGESCLFININGGWSIEEELEYQSAYQRIRYMKDCWHVTVPAEVVKPGMKIEFFSNNKRGIIDNIDVGAPNQLLLHTIAIGMLTPYREAFEFQKSPEYHRQYLQQIPVSQLIVSTYDPVYLKEIMLPDGQFFSDIASGEGGTYDGNMREYIGKDLISQGINYANYGFTSSKYNDYEKNLIAGQITIHTSIGKYENGIHVHGLSGGAGMATLNGTVGNELSHELGHNYGLGHYPGGIYGSVGQIPSTRNSTWGWDSDNHFFIPNFEYAVTNESTYLDPEANDPRPTAPFEGHSFGKDAMAGGRPLYPEVNAYTLHTPYVLSVIQKFFESRVIFDRASPTGFSCWNAKLEKMEPYKLINDGIDFFSMTVQNGVDITASDIDVYLRKNINILIMTSDGRHARVVYLPDADRSNNGLMIRFEINSISSVNVKINNTEETLNKGTAKNYISNGKRWEIFDYKLEGINIIPYKQGVKVITLLGYYDPENILTSYIYPALNGSYGNIYHYSGRSRCYLVIEYASGNKFSYALAPFRYISDKMNKFHINVERDLKPTILSLYIDGDLITQRKIDLGSDDLSYTVNGMSL